MAHGKAEDRSLAAASCAEQLREAQLEIRALKAANARLRAQVSAAERRAELAEEAARRAYAGFAAAGARR